MAGNAIANTFMTYSAKGLREDLTDVIWNVSPTETPFVTAIAKAKATNPFHEWQTDSLAAAAANAAVQGDDITSFDAVTATVRLGNRTQISRKSMIISGTEEVALKAGRKSEVAYQVVKKGKELRRDIEFNMLATNQAAVAASAGTAPLLASVISWIKTNTSKAGDGSDPAAADGTGTRTDGTTRPFTEVLLKTVLQGVFTNSGEQPDLLLVPPALKQSASAFPGNSTRFVNAESKELIAGIDVYSSDFGEIKIIPCRQMRTRDALVLNSDLWGLAFYRPVKMIELATTGDAMKRMLLAEYTLEARNEAGNGGVFDVS